MSIYNYYFGSDPELFLIKANNGFAHSAHLLKDFRPIEAKARDTEGSSTIKTDGFAMELNSDEGSSCRDWHVPNTAKVMRTFLEHYPDYSLSAKPMLKLTQESLTNAPDDVMGYGCVPDIDAYKQEEKTPPTTGYHDAYRYIGGHLHFSLTRTGIRETERLLAAAVAIILDVRLGVPLVAMLGRTNDYGEAARRRYYGQAGSHRVKLYGVEYRVPSSAIMLSPILYSWAIGQGRHVLQTVARPNPVTSEAIIALVKDGHGYYDYDRVKSIINNHDVDDARAFIQQHNLVNRMYQPAFVELMLKADAAGVGFDTNLVNNWLLRSDMPILNHGFIGVERAMNSKWRKGMTMPKPAMGYDYATNDYLIEHDIFPQLALNTKSLSWGL